MDLITFHLISVSSTNPSPFLATLQTLPTSDRPLWLGRCLHWIHQPHLSTDALLGPHGGVHKWDYLYITVGPAALPSSLQAHITAHWSITANAEPDLLAAYPTAHVARLRAAGPALPPGWSPSDPSALLAATPPPDLELSLALTSTPLGSSSGAQSIPLKDYIASRPATPVAMFNLLAYMPGQRARYFEYIAAFSASIGSKYGGDPVFLGLEATEWTSKGAEEEGGAGKGEEGTAGWVDAALVWYPSVWHFGKMSDDDGYVEVDRKFKQGALRDNPILCCEEVSVDYAA